MYTFSHFSCFASCAVKIYYIVHDTKHVYIKSNIYCIFVLLMNVAGVGFILLFENTDIVKSFRAWYTHICTYRIYIEGYYVIVTGRKLWGTDIINKLLGYFGSHNDQRYGVFTRVCANTHFLIYLNIKVVMGCMHLYTNISYWLYLKVCYFK